MRSCCLVAGEQGACRLPGAGRADLSYPPRPAGQAVTCHLGLAHSLPESLLTRPLLGPTRESGGPQPRCSLWGAVQRDWAERGGHRGQRS